jgi:ABC-type sugar transport system ATPase subunit
LTSPTSADASSRKSSASADGAALTAADLTKARRLRGVTFSVHDREMLVVLGPSGAGKTSLLRVIAGLESADGGSLSLDGVDLLRAEPERRRVALVFQDDALFPHMTIEQNLAFAMRIRRIAPAEIARRVRGIAGALEIEAHLRARPPALSGGERQRAAIARAVLSDPRVLLMDEPLAHLDPQLRSHVRGRIAQLRETFAGAAIHVTHDHVEALALGDRLAIMMEGRIIQCGNPQVVYDYPCSVAVASFFGSPPMNVIEDGTQKIGIRPERVQLDPDGELSGDVLTVEATGPDSLVTIRTPRGAIVARVNAGSAPAPGERAGVRFESSHVRRFDAAGTLVG